LDKEYRMDQIHVSHNFIEELSSDEDNTSSYYNNKKKIREEHVFDFHLFSKYKNTYSGDSKEGESRFKKDIYKSDNLFRYRKISSENNLVMEKDFDFLR
jgi:hypothetical protein